MVTLFYVFGTFYSKLNKNLESSLKKRSVMFRMGRDQRSVLGPLKGAGRHSDLGKSGPPYFQAHVTSSETRLSAVLDLEVPKWLQLSAGAASLNDLVNLIWQTEQD